MAVEIWRSAEKSLKPPEFRVSDFLKVASGKKEKPESRGFVGIPGRNSDPISTPFTMEANPPVLFSSILCKFGAPPLVIGFSEPPEIHNRFLAGGTGREYSGRANDCLEEGKFRWTTSLPEAFASHLTGDRLRRANSVAPTPMPNFQTD